MLRVNIFRSVDPKTFAGDPISAQKEILRILTENPNLTREELAKMLDASLSTNNSHVSALRKEGLLEYADSARNER